MTLATRSAARRHPHKANGHDLEADTCLLCGTSITTQDARARVSARLALLQQQAAENAKAEITAQVRRVQQEAAAATKVAVEKVRREATAAATASLELKIVQAVNAERERGHSERLKLVEQLADLKARLDRQDRPATSLGHEGHTNALTMLSEAFGKSYPLDEFQTVGPGKAGGDIIHVLRGGADGEVIARTLYEVKNTRTYSSRWAGKARADQIAGQFDHVVIVTSAFPTGKSDLIVESNGVLVCSFERLVAVATWLRLFCARSHSTKLAGQNRIAKADRLYQFMTSDKVADRWDRMAHTMTRMKDALRAERTQHEKLWSDRTDQMDVLHTIREGFVTDLDDIFEASDAEVAS